MFPFSPSLPIAFGTVGVLQRQVRQLLNADQVPADADARPVALTVASGNLGVLPREMDCRGWVYVEADSSENEVLVLACEARNTALYVAINIAEREPLRALQTAFDGNSLELLVASPGVATSHQLDFMPSEAKYVTNLVEEYLELCLPHDRDWLSAFVPAASRLPRLVAHLNPRLAACERQVLLVLQGSSENHLRAVRTALLQGAAH